MRPPSTPAIEFPGLALRPIELSDVPDWYAYLALPHVLEHTSWNLASADDLLDPVARYNSDDPSSPIRFALQENTSGRLVGTIGFQAISPAHRTAEIAYDLHPSLWGRGIASACVRATLGWGWSEGRYVRIQAVVLDTNAPSMRVLERTGFALEGKLRNYRMVRGRPRDFWMYSTIGGGTG